MSLENPKETICCTACHRILPVSGETSVKVFYSHPVLKVLICYECFLRTSNINDNNLCTWCGLSKMIINCSKCSLHFCKNCLLRILEEDKYLKVMKMKKWDCFLCTSMLDPHQTYCENIINNYEKMNNKIKEEMPTDEWDTSYDGDDESFESETVSSNTNKKKRVVEHIESIESFLNKFRDNLTEFKKKFHLQSNKIQVINEGRKYINNLLESSIQNIKLLQNFQNPDKTLPMSENLEMYDQEHILINDFSKKNGTNVLITKTEFPVNQSDKYTSTITSKNLTLDTCTQNKRIEDITTLNVENNDNDILNKSIVEAMLHTEDDEMFASINTNDLLNGIYKNDLPLKPQKTLVNPEVDSTLQKTGDSSNHIVQKVCDQDFITWPTGVDKNTTNTVLDENIIENTTDQHLESGVHTEGTTSDITDIDEDLQMALMSLEEKDFFTSDMDTECSSSNNEEDDVKNDISIRPCSVILERMVYINGDTLEKKTDRKTAAKSELSKSDNEMAKIERLTNLQLLERKRKINEDARVAKKPRINYLATKKSSANITDISETSTDIDSENDLNKGLGKSKILEEAFFSNIQENKIKSMDAAEELLKCLEFYSSDSDSEEEKQDKDTNKQKSDKKDDSNKENVLNTDIKVHKPLTEDKKAKLKNEEWKKDNLLNQRFSDSDSSDSSIEGENLLSKKSKQQVEELLKKKAKRLTEILIEPSSPKPGLSSVDHINTNSKSEAEATNSRIVINTDSTDSDIEFISENKKRSHRKKKSSSQDLICISSSDDSDSDYVDETHSKGRKNIRTMLTDESLEEATKSANLQEESRKLRLTQKQKHIDSFLSQSQTETVDTLILDIDHKTEKPLVVVDSMLVKRLKQHQHEGVRFMWNSCYESVEQLENGDEGSGCVLAHCMGLGKTFQVVTLVYTLFTHSVTKTKHVLIVCPLSIVLNWKNEFFKGLHGLPEKDKIKIHCISGSFYCIKKRLYTVNEWREKGGVLIMGYEAYQRLTTFKNLDQLSTKEINIKKTLVDPGPDLVVLDEGHVLKNGKTSRTKALMKIKTRRRIVLTGTPLQNNLKEYYYMVQFVKPNLLGSYREYTNRFVNPITNGQYFDSTPVDIHFMKKRIHVLHKLLEATIQRYEVSELYTYLPEKLDFVLFIQLHPVQATLCEKLIEAIKSGGEAGGTTSKGNLIIDYAKLHLVFSHPLLLHFKDEQKKNPQKKLKEIDVVDVEPETDGSFDLPIGWWVSSCPDDYKTNIEYGAKFKVMLSILQESEAVHDKVLIFSSSLLELDAIEVFLKQYSTNESKWISKQDYYRLDGGVPPEKRLQLCDSFNDANNKRARLLLMSHRVGGLGLNLVAANRVILMDVSWNPAHDGQSIFRIFRFGQKKQCYVYRLVAMGTMEEVVYQRTVNKLAIAGRVVDNMQMPRHYNNFDLQQMYKLTLNIGIERPPPDYVMRDVVLSNVIENCKEIFKYHDHQSLLFDNPSEQLNENERQKAWKEYNEQTEKENQEGQKRLQSQMQQIHNGANFSVRHDGKNNHTIVQETKGPRPIETIFIPDYTNVQSNKISYETGVSELKQQFNQFFNQEANNAKVTNNSVNNTNMLSIANTANNVNVDDLNGSAAIEKTNILRAPEQVKFGTENHGTAEINGFTINHNES